MSSNRYFSVEKDDTTGELRPVARLDMEHWKRPESWDPQNEAPQDWPVNAVDALISLFTGKTATEAGENGIELPDSLARHIAVLMEDWQGHEYGLNNTPQPGEDRRVKRADRTLRHVQRWYGQGIRLHEARLNQQR